MELRSPDPAIHPYLAFMLVMEAGLDGIAKQLSIPPAVDVDLYHADDRILEQLEQLPTSLEEAIAITSASPWIKEILPPELLERYLKLKQDELKQLHQYETADDYFMDQQFHRF